jgi:tetrapyrrole methylase family protein / MazG family protein
MVADRHQGTERLMNGPVRVVGLGPAGLDRVTAAAMALLDDPGAVVVVRTLGHPAAAELATRRAVIDCDDLYESAGSFDEAYAAIVERVMGLAERGPVIYAVPGSAVVGERAVRLLSDRVPGLEIEPGESFVDLALARVGVDPLDRGLQVLDAHALPSHLLLHIPTLIAQLDGHAAIDSVRDALLTLLDGDTEVALLADLGGPDEMVASIAVGDLRPSHAGQRTSLFVDVAAPGWPGLVATNARLRAECPWDREQTHHTLAKHLLEETYEVLEAIEALPATAPGGAADVAGYVDLEEELGDLLVQVVFHAALATEAGMFGVEEVAEGVRRKLVARHPHVFGDVDAPTAAHVMANWDALKRSEKERRSLLDGVPAGLPALSRSHEMQSRAAAAGFDWPEVAGALEKVGEEIGELVDAGLDPDRLAHEMGDLLFAVVNVARRLAVDPEQALRAATARFERRFRFVEEAGDLGALTLEQMDARWEEAKALE